MDSQIDLQCTVLDHLTQLYEYSIFFVLQTDFFLSPYIDFTSTGIYTVPYSDGNLGRYPLSSPAGIEPWRRERARAQLTSARYLQQLA